MNKKIAELAAPSPQRRGWNIRAERSPGTTDARLRASSPWLVKSAFPSPDQVTFGLRDGSQEELGVCGDDA